MSRSLLGGIQKLASNLKIVDNNPIIYCGLFVIGATGNAIYAYGTAKIEK